MFIEISHYFILNSLFLLFSFFLIFFFNLYKNIYKNYRKGFWRYMNIVINLIKNDNAFKLLIIKFYLLITNFYKLFMYYVNKNLLYSHLSKYIKTIKITKIFISNNIYNKFINIIFIYITLSILFLFFSYVISDFSVINIIMHSHTNQPLLYKICGVWGNHEGSITFWVSILSLYMFLLYLFNKSFMKNIFIFIIFIQTINLIFFLLFTIFTSNPFIRVNFFFNNGMELNPILQDTILAIHPPFLYLGYLGFSINFGLTIVILIINIIPKYWKIVMKIFNLISWCLLTIGISLGSWWAYYELGWGGWWFWDAVENISLIPWLFATALLHNLILNEKLDKFTHYSIILSLSAFFFSILGTFFVRSGLLISVHSFAENYSKSLYLLIYLLFLIFLIYCLLKISYKYLYNYFYLNFLSKENLIIINILFLIVATFIIIIATFLPTLLSNLLSNEIILGTDFFNKTLIPFVIPFIFLMVITPSILWNNDNINRFLYTENYIFGFLFYYMLIVYLNYYKDNSIILLIISLICIWGILNIIILLSLKIKNGMILSHLGIMIFIISTIISIKFKINLVDIIKPGYNIFFYNYNLLFRNISYGQTKNYNTIISNIIIENKNEYLGLILSERRSYYLHNNLISKPAINNNIFSDIYVVIADGNIFNGWFIRIIFNPLIMGIWLGFLLIFIGGIYSINSLKIKRSLNLI
jgi:cytochrome c-type biogenesis protein CcmF